MVHGARLLFRKVLSETVFFAVRFTKTLFQMQDGTCRYRPTCSQYSREALVKLPFYKAIPKIIKRVSSCRPGGGHGYDPVIPDMKEHNS